MCQQGDFIRGEVEFQVCDDVYVWRPICQLWECLRTHWYYTGDFVSHFLIYNLGDYPCDDIPIRGRHTRSNGYAGHRSPSPPGPSLRSDPAEGQLS